MATACWTGNMTANTSSMPWLDVGTAASSQYVQVKLESTATANVSLHYHEYDNPLGANAGAWVLNPPPQAYAPEFAAHILKRAEAILRRSLTSWQKRTWERFGYIDIPSPTKKHVAYRIPKTGLMVLYENGKPSSRLCIHGTERLPDPDRVLGLALLVRAEEDYLLKTANKHPVRLDHPSRPVSVVDRAPLWLPVRAA